MLTGSTWGMAKGGIPTEKPHLKPQLNSVSCTAGRNKNKDFDFVDG